MRATLSEAKGDREPAAEIPSVSCEGSAVRYRRHSELALEELEIKKKFVMALVAYAVLGILAWTTLSDEPISVFGMSVNLRAGTLVILGLFAFRAALYYWRVRIEEKRERSGPE